MKSRDRAEAFDAALRGRHCSDAQMRALAQQVDTIFAATSDIEPDEHFRTDLRELLLAEARTALLPDPAVIRARSDAPEAPKFRRRVAQVSAAAIVALGGVSLVASSAQAVPGDMLYSVKRGVENVELALHRSAEGRGEVQLAQAGERLAEAEALADAQKPDLAAEAITDFGTQAEAGANRLFEHYESEGNAASVERVNTFAVTASESLSALAEMLPIEADGAISEAMDAMQRLVDRARELCVECSAVTLEQVTTTPEENNAAAPPAPSSDEVAAEPTVPSATPPAPNPAPKHTGPAPSEPSAAPPAPEQRLEVPVVTPLLTGLLGDGDEQEGLVPGLLKGILGR